MTYGMKRAPMLIRTLGVGPICSSVKCQFAPSVHCEIDHIIERRLLQSAPLITTRAPTLVAIGDPVTALLRINSKIITPVITNDLSTLPSPLVLTNR